MRANVPDHRLFPDSDGYRRVADPDRYLGKFHFFNNDMGGKYDDVHQPDLGPGPSGSVHSDSAGLGYSPKSRDLRVNVCSAIPRWFGDCLYYRIVVYRLAAPLFTMGAGANVNAFFRYHHHDYRHPDRSYLQLVVHHVSGPYRLPFRNDVTIGFIVTFGLAV